MPVGVALGLGPFRHVAKFEIFEDIEIDGVIDDQLMTGLMGILVPHVRFVPLIAGGFLMGLAAIA